MCQRFADHARGSMGELLAHKRRQSQLRCHPSARIANLERRLGSVIINCAGYARYEPENKKKKMRHRFAAATSPSSVVPTSASRRCSTRFSVRRWRSSRPSRRPRATASPVEPRDRADGFLDTPGIHQARSLINRRMVDIALDTLHEVDCVLWLLDSRTRIGAKMNGSLKPCAR